MDLSVKFSYHVKAREPSNERDPKGFLLKRRPPTSHGGRSKSHTRESGKLRIGKKKIIQYNHNSSNKLGCCYQEEGRMANP